jgi:hypothetical protein
VVTGAKGIPLLKYCPSVLWLYPPVPIALLTLLHTLPVYWRLRIVLDRAKSRKSEPNERSLYSYDGITVRLIIG